MPIEIKELHIKTTISQDGNTGKIEAVNRQAGNTVNPDKLVAECVEKVLEILKNRSER